MLGEDRHGGRCTCTGRDDMLRVASMAWVRVVVAATIQTIQTPIERDSNILEREPQNLQFFLPCVGGEPQYLSC